MQIFIRELKRILTDRWQRRLLILIPVLLTIYFTVLFQQGIIQNISTVVIDQDQSTISRELIQQFDGSQYFQIVEQIDDMQQADQLIKDEVADVVITMPYGLNNDLKQGKPVKIGISADGSNMAISSTALRKASEIVLSYNAGVQIQKIEGKGYIPSASQTMARPLNLQIRQLFNNIGSYGEFLIWGLIAAIAHFPLMIFSSVSLHDLRDEFKLSTYLARLFSYALLGAIQLSLSFFYVIKFTPLKYDGDILHLVLLSAIFIFTVITFGMLVSTLIPSKILATQVGMIIVLPALLISGYTWPLERMPLLIQILGKAEPLTYYIHPLRDLAASGMLTIQYWQSLTVLSMMGLSFGVVSIFINVGRVRIWQRKSVTQ